MNHMIRACRHRMENEGKNIYFPRGQPLPYGLWLSAASLIRSSKVVNKSEHAAHFKRGPSPRRAMVQSSSIRPTNSKMKQKMVREEEDGCMLQCSYSAIVLIPYEVVADNTSAGLTPQPLLQPLLTKGIFDFATGQVLNPEFGSCSKLVKRPLPGFETSTKFKYRKLGPIFLPPHLIKILSPRLKAKYQQPDKVPILTELEQVEVCLDLLYRNDPRNPNAAAEWSQSYQKEIESLFQDVCMADYTLPLSFSSFIPVGTKPPLVSKSLAITSTWKKLPRHLQLNHIVSPEPLEPISGAKRKLAEADEDSHYQHKSSKLTLENQNLSPLDTSGLAFEFDPYSFFRVPDLVFLMDTKHQVNKTNGLAKKLGFSNIFCIDPIGTAGGLCLLWNSSVNLTINLSDSFFIACSITGQGFTFGLICFYLSTKQSVREGKSFKQSLSQAYIFVGDFNDCVSPEEKNGGLPFDFAKHITFQDFINDLSMRSHPHCIQERLDRCLANIEWMNFYKHAQVLHLEDIGSDHCVMLLNFDTSIKRPPKHFHFDKNWVTNDQIQTIIMHTWQQQQLTGSLIHFEFQLCKARLQEETFWRQKSRKIWLHLGDNNTKYFHASTKQRHRKNTIRGIMDSQQVWHYDSSSIEQVILQHFKEQYATSMGDHMLSNFNHTLIALIPKNPNPQIVADSRPINLCSVYYKIISKILTHRLQRMLPAILSSTQNAFTKGRAISDNILIVHEVMHYLKTKASGKNHFMALRLDVSKAYDRLEWGYIKAMLIKWGFCHHWVSWIMECISTVSFPIRINGVNHGYFKPTRGLRQGYPLSPLLYVLCSEGLSHIIHDAAMSKSLTSIKITHRCPSITHLLFADDTIIFSKATLSHISFIKNLLNLYSLMSGQHINYSKSFVFFNRDVEEFQAQLFSDFLGISQHTSQGKYRGLPFQILRSKNRTFAGIVNQIATRLHSWKQVFLSSAGKEILIKAVATTILVYVMMCFAIPKSLCHRINQLIRQFWWGQQIDENKMCWIAWEKLCHTSLGHRPSRGWKSLRWGFQLLQKGLRWNVSTSQSINCLEDLWIPGSYPFLPHRIHSALTDPYTVSTFINSSSRSWNQQLLQAYFEADDVAKILSIPLSYWPDKDILVWHFHPSGQYSVKSGYYVAFHQQYREFDSLIPSMSKKDWQFLWQIPIPHKIQIFIWRCLHNGLPSVENLNFRLNLHQKCVFCDQEESVVHILFHCERALQIWFASPLSFCLNWEASHSFVVQWKSIISRLSALGNISSISLFCFHLLYIWKSRISLLFRLQTIVVSEVILFSMDAHREFEDSLKGNTTSHPTQTYVPRNPPLLPAFPLDTIHITYHAATAKNHDFGVAGVIAKKFQLQTISKFSVVFRHICDPGILELLVLREAMNWAQSNNWKKVCFKGDAIQVSTIINSKTCTNLLRQDICEDIWHLQQAFDISSFHYIPRSLNTQMGTNDSISRKRGRGPTRGKELQRLIDAANKKPEIVIDPI
ncbi:uncharacterized protein LOC126661686 [Mercurialis annua]|uniref:uncharacterized protein LOC126661686 n=1 Tax=Mercurialis annua TaxID=3986 RepID=UPI00215F7705|nr:uncharacterized protein LOC126661686 [Mercurialis annua]